MLCFVDDGFSFGGDNFFYWFGFVESVHTQKSAPIIFQFGVGAGRACVRGGAQFAVGVCTVEG